MAGIRRFLTEHTCSRPPFIGTVVLMEWVDFVRVLLHEDILLHPFPSESEDFLNSLSANCRREEPRQHENTNEDDDKRGRGR
jgi:hypothetical protein